MVLIRCQVWNFHDILIGEFRLRLCDDVHLTYDFPKDPSALLLSMDNVQPGVLEQYSELDGELGSPLDRQLGTES